MTGIRLASLSDLDRIDRIEARSFSRDRFPRRNLRRMLKGGRTRFLLADAAAGQAAGEGGYLALARRRGCAVARVYSLAVDPASRGHGLAAGLLAAAAEQARRDGCDRLRLEVREGNATAVRLYRDAGFFLRGRREAYYDDGETALLFEADLAAKEAPRQLESPPS